MQLVSKLKCVFRANIERERTIGGSMGHSHYTDLISTAPPTPKHTQLLLHVSCILFKPWWVKALSLPSFNKMPVHSSWGFHVSLNTERLGQKKRSTREKSHLRPHPFCGSGHEQTACFHHRGNPFHFTLANHVSLHTQSETPTHTEGRVLTIQTSQIQRDKRFSSHTMNKTSWLFVMLVAKLSEKLEETPFLSTGEIYGPSYFEKHCV